MRLSRILNAVQKTKIIDGKRVRLRPVEVVDPVARRDKGLRHGRKFIWGLAGINFIGIVIYLTSDFYKSEQLWK